MQRRYLAVVAGPFRLALPITSVRQILDVGDGEGLVIHAPGGPSAAASEHPAPMSLARLLGDEPWPGRTAVLLLDGHAGPVPLSCCRLEGVFDAGPPAELPATVVTRWPGLVVGLVLRPAVDEGQPPGLLLLVDTGVLMGLVEASAAAARAPEIVDG